MRSPPPKEGGLADNYDDLTSACIPHPPVSLQGGVRENQELRETQEERRGVGRVF